LILHPILKNHKILTSPLIPILFIACYPLTDAAFRLGLITSFVIILLFFYSSIFVWFIFFSALSFFHFPPLAFFNEGPSLFNLKFLFVSLAGFLCFLTIRVCLSLLFFKIVNKKDLIPKISPTEQASLLVGDPWIEREFFTG